MRIYIFTMLIVVFMVAMGCKRDEVTSKVGPFGLCVAATYNTAVWGGIEGWSDPETVTGLMGSDLPRKIHYVDVQVNSIIWGDVEPGKLQTISFVAIDEDGTTDARSNVMPLKVDGALVEGVIFLKQDRYHSKDGFVEEYSLAGLYRQEGDRLIGMHDEYTVEEFIPFAREINETRGGVCVGLEDENFVDEDEHGTGEMPERHEDDG